MKPIIIAGTTIVIFALTFYSIGIITELRKHRATLTVVRFLTLGVICDIVATILMIIGSEKDGITIHGLLGFSSLSAMVSDTIVVWRHRLKSGDSIVPRWLHVYSLLAYIWWVLAFISGALLVAFSQN